MTTFLPGLMPGSNISSFFGGASAPPALLMIGLLLILLAQKEFLQICGSWRCKEWAQMLNVAIVPLLLAFGIIVVERLVSIVSST